MNLIRPKAKAWVKPERRRDTLLHHVNNALRLNGHGISRHGVLRGSELHLRGGVVAHGIEGGAGAIVRRTRSGIEG
jgi:hypothetical protein